MTSSPPSLRIDRHDGVLQLTLDAPAARNSLGAPGLLEGLVAGLQQLEQDAALRCAVITGAGGSFSSGGDLRSLSSGTEMEIRAVMQKSAWIYRRIALTPKPVVAAVDGPAFGAGLGLAACCDFVVAGATARFCAAFTRVGAMPDAALFWSLPARVGLPRARRMMVFAEELDAAGALACGLADEQVADGSALPAALRMAQRLAQGPTRAYARIKTGLRQGPMPLEQALDFQLDNAPALFASEDFREGAAAFLDKRTPVFRGR